jgi:hypothetical protein
MVNPQAAVQELIVYVAGLNYFEKKQEIMYALLDLAWSLRDAETTEELPEEFQGGREAPWCD